MSGALQVRVYDRQQLVYADEFAGVVEMGRQRDGTEAVYASRPENGHWRAVVARLDEDTLSREHARVELLSDGRVRLKNLSAKVQIRLPDGSELGAGVACELAVPTVLTLGNKTIQLQPSEEASDPPGAPLRSLDEATSPPGSGSGLARFTDLSMSHEVLGAQLEEVLRWLRATMDVLQHAASSSDFFQRAAQAVVDIVGLDRGRVLLLENDAWRSAASRAAAHVSGTGDRGPSRQVLARVRREKKTFWRAPEKMDLDGIGSLLGIEVVMAAPILSPAGEVIGAIYGDRREDSPTAGVPDITRLEAMLVELLARAVAAGLARMEQERAALAAHVQFEQFFTPELSRQLALQPDLLDGRDSEVTILFCDIRGFSRISERLGPEGTVELVGHVMGALSDCVLKHQGVLVDYIGDELMAMWGAPEEQPDHPLLACRAALEMLGCLPGLCECWQSTLGEPLDLGIGINTGIARVGNTGSRQKFKYGPLGNTVNLASRVQGATKYLRCPLLLTGSTRWRLTSDFHARELCQARVINITQPVQLYQLVLPSQPGWPDLKTRYESALEEFDRGDFRRAARTLGNLLAEQQDDGPSLVLMSRAVNALVEGPSEMHPVWDLPGK
jgi:adenylate cyclase